MTEKKKAYRIIKSYYKAQDLIIAFDKVCYCEVNYRGSLLVYMMDGNYVLIKREDDGSQDNEFFRFEVEFMHWLDKGM